ncbi:transposase [Streptomyces sp. NPDC001792]|uniref:transposase n=1 Tax=Streptomyces sp. NPDC001792 TaxID=3154524 RepID=UPI0033324BBA
MPPGHPAGSHRPRRDGPGHARRRRDPGGDRGSRRRRRLTEASFAALCGVSQIEYSSGRRHTRRLDYGGDRRANAALHRIVFTRLRHDPRPQAYYERRTQEGKTRLSSSEASSATRPGRSPT